MLVEANGPFDVDSVLSTLSRHEIEGLTVTDLQARTHRRIVTVAGEPAELLLGFEEEGVEVSGPTGLGDPSAIGELVRGWFDLGTDISSVDRQLASYGILAAQVESNPGVRITGHPDLWEAVVLTVLGQQVSLGAARTFAARLVAGYGERQDGLCRFPEPGRILGHPVDRLREILGLTGARARSIHELAALFVEDPAPDFDRLSTVPGMGPWTLACVAIRGGLHPDEFPASDAVLRRALGGVDATEAEAISAAWSPFRSYAAVRLWAAEVPVL